MKQKAGERGGRLREQTSKGKGTGGGDGSDFKMIWELNKQNGTI